MATTLLRPDQTFYPSPRLAATAPVETLAYMVTFDPTRQKPDGLTTVDVDPKSKGFGTQIGRVDAPNVGDEFHHFGWNVCSSALCPYAAHPHLERRYLLVPGLPSSRIYIFDIKPAPRSSPTTSGGISATTPPSPASGARPTWSRAASIPRSCWPASTVTRSTSGTCRSAAIARRSTSARSIRCRSSCARRTTRARRMGLSASLPA